MIRALLLLSALALLFARGAKADEPSCSGELNSDKTLPLFVPVKKGDDAFGSRCLHFTRIPVGHRTRLLVWGSITEGDSERFRAAVAQSKPIDEVDFFSPGGSLTEGLQIGRIVRAEKLTTHIPRHMECASACNFMFMGGVVRSVDPGADFVVHMFDKQMLPEVILLKLLEAKVNTDKGIRTAEASVRPVAQRPQARLLPPSLPDLTAAPAKPGGPESRPASGPGGRNGAAGEFGCSERSLVSMLKDLTEQLNNKDVSISVARQVVKLAKGFVDPALCDEFTAMLKPLSEFVVETEEDDARTAAEMARFLVDMSLSLRFLTEFANIPNHRPRALTRDELRDFNIVNTE